MTTRTYVRQLEDAIASVAEIARLVKGGHADPLISFDIETRAIAGLEGYPGTTFDQETGERVKATKKAYLEFTQVRWSESFSPMRLLQAVGVAVPRKLTAGNERPGVKAGEAWRQFHAAVQATSDEALEAARWRSYEVEGLAGTLAEYGAALQGQLAGFEAARGKKKSADAVRAEIAHNNDLIGRIPAILERLNAPLDIRLLRHIVTVGVENRVKVDPVEPGLDPQVSDIFTVQVTLRRTLDRELLTWVFNAAQVPLEALRPVLKLGRAYTYIAQNAKFDLKHIMHKLGLDAAPRNVYCTRTASRMLYLGLKMSHSLAALAPRFAGVKMDKSVRDTFIGVRRDDLTQEQIDYGAFDTEVLFPIYDKQMALARERGQVELIRQFSKLNWITGKWELDGYLVDDEKWLAITAETTAARDDLARQLEDILLPAGYRETFGAVQLTEEQLADLEVLVEAESDPDDEDSVVDVRHDALIRISQGEVVKERLIEVLGADVAAAAFPNGKVSLGEIQRNAWERAYRDAHGGETHPFFLLYALWSKRAKQVSTYGKKFLWNRHPLTGAIHPSMSIAGTDTGRYSGRKPNPFNIPAAKEVGDPDYRSAFYVPEGKLLLGADYESMELRIAFCVTEEGVGLRMVQGGKDSHAFTAAMMFHIRRAKVSEVRKVKDKFKYGSSTFEIDVWEVPEDWTAQQVAELALSDEVIASVMSVPKKTTRTVAKMVSFLWLFRGSAFTLSMRTGLPLAQCEDFFARFNATYPDMAEGMDALADEVLKNTVEGNDGYTYAFARAYGGLMRWFKLPEAPSRRDYAAGWAGDCQFQTSQKVYKRKLNSVKREACNVPMQGGNAYITACALNELVEQGHSMGVYPFLAIYDEIIEVFPDTVRPEVVKGLLESVMLDTADEWMTYCPAGAEADVSKAGSTWKKS